MTRALLGLFALFTALALLPATPAGAWTADSQVAIADWAARIAPPDLRGQIEHRAAHFHRGVLEAPADAAGDPGSLIRRIEDESRRAVAMIEQQRPFDDFIYQLGIVSRLVAAAADPLGASDADPEEARYAADFRRYAESARPRLNPVFYGIPPADDSADALGTLIAATFERSRQLYPAVGREYRRIDFGDGRRAFDDRSTAFGVVAVAYSQAISDVAVAFRYIWLRAGGGDPRTGLPVRRL